MSAAQPECASNHSRTCSTRSRDRVAQVWVAPHRQEKTVISWPLRAIAVGAVRRSDGKRRRIAQDVARLPQLRRRPGTGVGDLDDNADPLPFGERHADQAPDIGRRCRFGDIVEQPMQRQVKCDAKDWHGRLPGVFDKPVGNPQPEAGPAKLWITLWIAFG